MAMKKVESRICPSKTVTGESTCVCTLHTALLFTPGVRTAGVCRVLAAPAAAPRSTRDAPELGAPRRTRGPTGKLPNGPSFVL